jgi:hypothetical protein
MPGVLVQENAAINQAANALKQAFPYGKNYINRM